MEPIHEVRAPWKELRRDSDIKWEPGPADKYTGPSGGPLAGTSKNIFRLVDTAESIA